jgi:hypothetical protein
MSRIREVPLRGPAVGFSIHPPVPSFKLGGFRQRVDQHEAEGFSDATSQPTPMSLSGRRAGIPAVLLMGLLEWIASSIALRLKP